MTDPCSSCRHFHAKPDAARGSCRRYPQSVEVPADYGCGEFAAATITLGLRVPVVAPALPPAFVPVATAPAGKRGKRQ